MFQDMFAVLMMIEEALRFGVFVLTRLRTKCFRSLCTTVPPSCLEIAAYYKLLLTTGLVMFLSLFSIADGLKLNF